MTGMDAQGMIEELSERLEESVAGLAKAEARIEELEELLSDAIERGDLLKYIVDSATHELEKA